MSPRSKCSSPYDAGHLQRTSGLGLTFQLRGNLTLLKLPGYPHLKYPAKYSLPRVLKACDPVYLLCRIFSCRVTYR